MLVVTAVKHEEKKEGEQKHALSRNNNVKGKGSECKQEETRINIWEPLACSIIFCCYSAALFAFWASLQGWVWSRDPWQGRPKLAGYTWPVPSFHGLTASATYIGLQRDSSKTEVGIGWQKAHPSLDNCKKLLIDDSATRCKKTNLVQFVVDLWSQTSQAWGLDVTGNGSDHPQFNKLSGLLHDA